MSARQRYTDYQIESFAFDITNGMPLSMIAQAYGVSKGGIHRVIRLTNDYLHIPYVSEARVELSKRHGNWKLQPCCIEQIKKEPWHVSNRELAALYNVSRQQIWRIRKGYRWPHI